MRNLSNQVSFTIFDLSPLGSSFSPFRWFAVRVITFDEVLFKLQELLEACEGDFAKGIFLKKD